MCHEFFQSRCGDLGCITSLSIIKRATIPNRIATVGGRLNVVEDWNPCAIGVVTSLVFYDETACFRIVSYTAFAICHGYKNTNLSQDARLRRSIKGWEALRCGTVCGL